MATKALPLWGTATAGSPEISHKSPSSVGNCNCRETQKLLLQEPMEKEEDSKRSEAEASSKTEGNGQKSRAQNKQRQTQKEKQLCH